MNQRLPRKEGRRKGSHERCQNNVLKIIDGHVWKWRNEGDLIRQAISIIDVISQNYLI